MLKKIGLLTVIGLFLVVIFGILYFSSIHSVWSFENYIFYICGIIAGIILVTYDFISIQKRNKNKILDPRLKVYGIIFIIGIIALIIDAIIISSYIREYAWLFSLLICITIYIPAIIIGFAFFLIFLRTPYAKYIEGKKIKIFYIALAIIIILLPIIFGWSSFSPTYADRQPIDKLSLSYDGTKLLLLTRGTPHISPIDKETECYNCKELQIWDIASGKTIYSKYPIEDEHSWSMYSDTSGSIFRETLSPNGIYFISENATIYNSSTGEIIDDLGGNYKDWSSNDKYIITSEYSNIYIWHANNFSQFKSISGIKSDKIIVSPTGSHIAVFSGNTVSVIEIYDDEISTLWEINLERINMAVWSKNGDMIQFIRYIPGNHRINGEIAYNYNLSIYNVTDGKLMNEISFEFIYGEMADNLLCSSDFEKYIIYYGENDKISFYNLTNLELSINLNYYLSAFDISDDGKIIALGYSNGIIEIRNSSTGEIIKTLKTKEYEIIRTVPGFEIILVACAIALVMFWKRKKRIKTT